MFSKTLLTLAVLAAPSFAAPLVTRGVTNTNDKTCLEGTYKHPSTGVCTALNGCVFVKTDGLLLPLVGNLLGWKVDSRKALDLELNTCVTVETCKADLVKQVIQTTVAGWSKVNVCAVKTCATGQLLVSRLPHIHDLQNAHRPIDLQDIKTGTCIAASSCATKVGSLCHLLTGTVDLVGKTIVDLDSLISATLKSLAHVVISLDASLRASLTATIDLAVRACADLRVQLLGLDLSADASIFASLDLCVQAIATLRSQITSSVDIGAALYQSHSAAVLALADLKGKLATIEVSAQATAAALISDCNTALLTIQTKLSATLSASVHQALLTSTRAIADVKVLLSKTTIVLDASLRACLSASVSAVADLEAAVSILHGKADAKIHSSLAATVKLVAELKARVEADVVLRANADFVSKIDGCLVAIAQIQAAIALDVDLDVAAAAGLTVA